MFETFLFVSRAVQICYSVVYNSDVKKRKEMKSIQEKLLLLLYLVHCHCYLSVVPVCHFINISLVYCCHHYSWPCFTDCQSNIWDNRVCRWKVVGFSCLFHWNTEYMCELRFVVFSLFPISLRLLVLKIFARIILLLNFVCLFFFFFQLFHALP